MAVRSRGPGIYEFTATDDKLLEVLKVESFTAICDPGGNTGDVEVRSNIIQTNSFKNGAMQYDATNEAIVWKAVLTTPNSIEESVIDFGYIYGIKVTMPPGCRLIVSTAYDG